MNNEKINNNNNNNLPLAIIGLVLLAAIGGGWWFYSNSKTTTKPINTNSVNKKTPEDKAALDLYAKAPPGAQPANMLGSPTAAVTVEEFADYQCPTCAITFPKMKQITSLYGNRIKFIYRNFPITQIHQHAYESAVTAEAAGQQDRNKFWEMQNQLFSNQKEWENSSDARKLFEGYAQKIGLDMTRFENDIVGLAVKSRVDADLQRGRAAGVKGTPTIFINGKEVPFEMIDVDPLRRLIDDELQKTTAQSAPNQTPQPANEKSSVNAANNSAENKEKK